MVDMQRSIVIHSVRDVISILRNAPVKGDMVVQITAVQVMNRVSLAHLSIERTMKFLTTTAGGLLNKIHGLGSLFQQLRDCAPEAAEFLERAFAAAVEHYRYNPNAANMTHLKNLEQYLALVGSNEAFQDVRYWELEQSLDEVILRTIHLNLHFELLQALSELLLNPTMPMQTVTDRVDRAVQRVLIHTPDLANSPGTPKEGSVHAYLKWLRTFTSLRDALADAVQRDFEIGDELAANVVRNAYDTLNNSSDPAIRYFASTLDVLPPQPRDVVPYVEWLGPTKFRSGSVTTPAGKPLGFIDRGLDGLWYITPLLTGRVSSKAKTQTDARSYLAAIQSSPVKVTVGGADRPLRIVGEEHYLYQKNFDEVRKRFEGMGDDTIWTHKVVFWDKDHGIKVDDIIEMEVRLTDTPTGVHKLAGRVTEVAEHEVYLSGEDLYDLTKKETD